MTPAIASTARGATAAAAAPVPSESAAGVVAANAASAVSIDGIVDTVGAPLAKATAIAFSAVGVSRAGAPGGSTVTPFRLEAKPSGARPGAGGGTMTPGIPGSPGSPRAGSPRAGSPGSPGSPRSPGSGSPNPPSDAAIEAITCGAIGAKTPPGGTTHLGGTATPAPALGNSKPAMPNGFFEFETTPPIFGGTTPGVDNLGGTTPGCPFAGGGGGGAGADALVVSLSPSGLSKSITSALFPSTSGGGGAGGGGAGACGGGGKSLRGSTFLPCPAVLPGLVSLVL